MHRFRIAGGAAAFVAAWIGLATPTQAGSCGTGIVCNVVSWTQTGADVDFALEDAAALRVSVLADDLVRVRFAPSGGIVGNVSRAVVKTDWVAPAITVTDGGSAVTIATASLQVVVGKSPCVVDVRDSSGTMLVGDDPAQRMQWDGSSTRVYKTTQSGESYLGLGWRTLGLRRNGSRFVMDNVPNYGSPETFYGGVPLWYGLRNGHAYGIFFDDTSLGEINVGQASSSYVYFQNLGAQVDYYVFGGPSMAQILDRYTELTGRPFMPPKWAIGYQQCRWSYTPQSEVLSIANEFRTRSIPCDVMYLDIDYMPGARALTFNSSTFPTPAAMCTTLHAQGFQVVANISPFLIADDPRYSAARTAGHLLRKADGNVLTGWHDYWYFVGGAGTGSLSWIDFSRTATRFWWQSQHTSFLNNGIDGIWNDLNEPDELGGAWPADVKYDFDGAPVNHNKTSTQYCLLQTDFSYDTLAAHYGNRRPFVLSRASYAGMQRSSATWSGDNVGDWANDMQRDIPMGLSMSLCGQSFNGHDIGGFFGYPGANDPPNTELYTRWMEWGVFTGLCRQHHDGFGNHSSRPYTEPWRFGSTVETICRDYISLRYRLMPYLYSLFADAHETGAPVYRPTVYDFSSDAATLTQDYDFMFGPYMLISPVYEAGASTRSVYLPAGTDWVDWWDGTVRTGGASYVVSAPLDRMPIHVRRGAIIPMGPVMQYADQAPLSELTLEVFPGTSTSSFTMYEDDGISFDYLSGASVRTTYTTRRRGVEFQLDVAARQGSYVPTARTYMVKAHAWTTTVNRANVNGTPLTARASKAALDGAAEGYYHDTAAGIVYLKFADTGGAMSVRAGDASIAASDFDVDGDVDLADFAFLQLCFNGPNRPYPFDSCGAADMEPDGDVDLADFASFLSCFNGPSRPPACEG